VRFSLGRDEIFIAADWSPDGKAIADIRTSRGYGPGTLEIRTFQEGRSRVLLTDQSLVGGGGNVLEWLPDGRILFGLFKDSISESGLWAIPLDSSGAAGGKPTRLTNTTGSYVAAASASADGKHLAILPVRYPFSIFVAGLSKTGGKLEQPLRLTNDSWNNWPSAWAPDSQTLFYASSRHNASIYKRALSSDSPELFAGGPERYTTASVSPDGAWVIVGANLWEPNKGRLLRIPVSGGTPETILAPGGPGEVVCAPSGSRICVISEAIGKQEVFSTVDPVRGRLAELAKIDSQGAGTTFWSPFPGREPHCSGGKYQ
jgi:Tol biopolymer transport system component